MERISAAQWAVRLGKDFTLLLSLLVVVVNITCSNNRAVKSALSPLCHCCLCVQNVVAMGAGFVDGLKYGDNTKSAVIRLGLMEMIAFSRQFVQGQHQCFIHPAAAIDMCIC